MLTLVEMIKKAKYFIRIWRKKYGKSGTADLPGAQ
jgi:hypothetical protein